jgi:hypothetical protein
MSKLTELQFRCCLALHTVIYLTVLVAIARWLT